MFVFAVHPEKVSGPGEVSFREVFFTHHAQLSHGLLNNRTWTGNEKLRVYKSRPLQ